MQSANTATAPHPDALEGATAGLGDAMGAPHLGHEDALSLTSEPHSEHFTSAIAGLLESQSVRYRPPILSTQPENRK